MIGTFRIDSYFLAYIDHFTNRRNPAQNKLDYDIASDIRGLRRGQGCI